MSSRNIEAIYRLSPTQEGILFHTLESAVPGAYFVQYACVLAGPLKPQRLRFAWQEVTRRHAALRTLFTWEQRSQPLQIVRERVSLTWDDQDWSTRSAAEQRSDWSQLRRRDRERGFELTSAPLQRFTLIRTGGQRHLFLWSFHHLILDGWSMRMILEEVLSLYDAGPAEGLPAAAPARPYADFIAWLEQRDAAQEEAFWSRTLRGFTAPTSPVPAAAPHAAGGPRAAHEFQVTEIDAQTLSGLVSLARRERLTLSSLVLGAWALVLARWSASDDVVFGMTVAGRPAGLEGAERIAGLFINTLPLRVPVPDDPPLLDWLRDVQTRQVAARGFEHTPLVAAQRWSEVPAGQALFDSLVVYEKVPEPGASRAPRTLEVRDEDYVEYSNYPLAILAFPADRLTLKAAYDPLRLDAAQAARLLDHMRTVLEEMLRAPAQPLGEVSMLPAAERELILQRWNDTRVEFPRDACIHELVTQCAARTPPAIALAGDTPSLSYAGLERRANQLANRLLRHGVARQAAVPVFLERSLEAIVAMLAILKAGAAYVPLDPGFPRERVRHVLEDLSGSAPGDAGTPSLPLILTREHLVEGLPRGRCEPLCLDREAAHIAAEDSADPGLPVDPAALAYVVYTSGSSGRPKGVMVSHRNLVNSTLARAHHYPDRPSSFLLLSSLATDSSVAGIYWALTTGATLVLPRARQEQDVASLSALIAAQRVSHLLCLPSLWSMLLEQADHDRLGTLQAVILAGEACSPAVVERHHRALPGVALYNEYGPSEATVWATMAKLGPDATARRVTIGRPIANLRTYLLDAHMRPVPVGLPGELYIGGAGVAAGYLNQPERTAERFLCDPFAADPGARLYRTGDLARYTSEGDIEFLGRSDNQVKIRGYRVELEEIERTLRLHPAIADAAVVLRDAGSRRVLQACVVSQPGEVADAESLRAFLAQRLPDYMLPQAFLPVEDLPRTPAGKIDRSRLPSPQDGTPVAADTDFVAPRNAAEQTLARIWAEVLGVEEVGVHDDFFEVGGDSLLSIRILSRAGREGLAMSTEDFFAHPTIAAQAAAAAGRPQTGAATDRAAAGTRPLVELDQSELARVARMLGDVDGTDEDAG